MTETSGFGQNYFNMKKFKIWRGSAFFPLVHPPAQSCRQLYVPTIEPVRGLSSIIGWLSFRPNMWWLNPYAPTLVYAPKEKPLAISLCIADRCRCFFTCRRLAVQYNNKSDGQKGHCQKHAESLSVSRRSIKFYKQPHHRRYNKPSERT